ncbi:hypothetical protein QO200_13040 [Flavobacterium sp. Arc3]|jgi:hypothetical protein|uniref:hypothetical protein n=1 Tax=unclassified Flavobacterium TaxID=196869 RepID=UPI00352CB549
MKKKQLVISLSLSLTVLFSILFQSLHTYEHFVKQFSETECHHKYSNGEPEITHQHHNFDDCKVCHFTFGSYVSPDVFVYSLQSNFENTPYFFEKVKTFISFPGSLYSPRGPPLVII